MASSGFCCFGGFNLDRWLRLVDEEALEPELDIIDPHFHLFDVRHEPRGDLSLVGALTSCCSRRVTEGFLRLAFPAAAIGHFGIHNMLTQHYLAEDLQADFGGHKVVGTVCVEYEMHDPKARAPELGQVLDSKIQLASRQRCGAPSAYVCHVDLRLGKDKVLAGIRAHKAANPHVRGLRHQLAWDASKTIFSARTAEQGLMSQANFRSGFSALQEEGLTFEAWVYFTQLKDVAELARAFPGTNIVLNHVGTPLGMGVYADKAEAVQKEWEAGLRELASCPNVWVKLSGMGMPCVGLGFDKRARPPTSDEMAAALEPWLRVAVDAFSTDRCMFASNFPVDRVSSSYVVLFNAFKKVCGLLKLSEADKRKMFHDNAAHFYRLNQPETEP